MNKNSNSKSTRKTIVDLGDYPPPQGSDFIDRAYDLDLIHHWISQDHIKIVGIFGFPGIGKTSLALILCQQLKKNYDFIICRSLQSAPYLGDLISGCVKTTSGSKKGNNVVDVFINLITRYKCLIVLDNIETILSIGVSSGRYVNGYEDYRAFFKKILAAEHQSCIIVTGRELPLEIRETNDDAIKSIEIEPFLNPFVGTYLFECLGVKCTKEQYEIIGRRFQGNPLALKLFANTLKTIFDGDVGQYLKEGYFLFDSIQDVLNEQFKRLSSLEYQAVSVIALNNGSITKASLLVALSYLASPREIETAFNSLRARSLIEVTLSKISIHPVVLEYARVQLSKLLSNIETSITSQKNIMTAFLSYAREDQEIVQAYYQKLLEAGVKPWMDIYDLLPGQNWKMSIERSLHESDFILLFLSKNSVTKRGYIRKEIRDALEISQMMLSDDIFIIPVRIDDCQVPHELENLQWLNLFEENSWDKLIKSLTVGFEKRQK